MRRKEQVMRKTALAVMCLGAIVLGASAQAGQGFRAVPSGGAGWHANEGPDIAGRGGNHAMHLQAASIRGNRPSDGEGGGFVVFEGVEGITLSELGFDIRNGETCTDFDPTVFVYTEPAGDQFHFDCTAGTRTPAPDDPLNWTRVRFTHPSDNPSPPWPGFGNVVVREIYINFLSFPPAQTHMDNFDINGVLIGGPGNHN